MKHFDLYTEPYGVTGNIGENFLRLLGTPSHDQLLTVVREAVQNVADAAALGRGPEILIRIRHLHAAQRETLRGAILTDLPGEETSRVGLQRFLDDPDAIVLEICDFGTTGLGGPTRADRIPVGTERTDFINFLRNIGTPRDTKHGGGTYGFGKASLYSISRCHTILVDTLTSGEAPERRLIGCHIGPRHERIEGAMKRQFTGRYWWGIPDPHDGIVDPAFGPLAATLADMIGFPERDGARTGTSIMILDPATGSQDLRLAGQRIIEGLLWSFWPRMMRDTPATRRFTCRVMVGDEELTVPPPDDFPPLDLFCKAMRAARRGAGNDVRPIASQRPIKHLGVLAVEKGLRGQRRLLVNEESLFPRVSHHIALMRPVELVVKYLEGAALPDDRVEWAGVFLVDEDDEVEAAFALAEPPAHDDWIPGNLEKGSARTFVKVALGRLHSCAGQMGEPASARPPPNSGALPLARVASRLGAALAGEGDGAGTLRRPAAVSDRASERRHRRARASAPVFSRLIRVDGLPLAIFATEVSQGTSEERLRLVANASIALDGGSGGKMDASISPPKIHQIRSTDGTLSSSTNSIDIDGVGGAYEIAVKVPQDCAVTVDVTLSAAEPIQ